MAELARLRTIETTRDARGSVRRKLRLQVGVPSLGSPDSTATIHDLSNDGLLIETTANLSIGDVFEVDLPEAALRMAEVVWKDDRLFGCRIVEAITPGVVSAALLRSSPQPAPAEGDLQTRTDEGLGQPGEAGSELSPRARFGIKVGLALLSWALVGGLVALVLR